MAEVAEHGVEAPSPSPPSEEGSEPASVLVGRLVEVKGGNGWVVPLTAVDHPLAHWNRGRIYLSMEDVRPFSPPLQVGDMVEFSLYCDKKGLGAEDCHVVTHDGGRGSLPSLSTAQPTHWQQQHHQSWQNNSWRSQQQWRQPLAGPNGDPAGQPSPPPTHDYESRWQKYHEPSAPVPGTQWVPPSPHPTASYTTSTAASPWTSPGPLALPPGFAGASPGAFSPGLSSATTRLSPGISSAGLSPWPATQRDNFSVNLAHVFNDSDDEDNGDGIAAFPVMCKKSEAKRTFGSADDKSRYSASGMNSCSLTSPIPSNKTSQFTLPSETLRSMEFQPKVIYQI